MGVDDLFHEGEDSLKQFLARIQAGDQDAAREMLIRYEPEVRLVVRRQLPKILRARFDSLDFLQSVWGSFFRRVRSKPGLAEFEDERHLVAFLSRAAKNKMIDEYRKAGSQKQDMRREEPIWADGDHPRELEAHTDSPSEVAQRNETLDRLRDLLPEERQAILDLKAQGLSSREIGERLGISERTVQRVIEDLRRRAEQDDQIREQRREIRDFKAQGLSVPEIARRLGLGEQAVQGVVEEMRRRADDREGARA